MNFNLALPFYHQARIHSERVALCVDGVSYSYGELADLAARTALALGPAQTVGILAGRSLGTYLGVLGTSWCGAAYVPINPKLPAERLGYMLRTIKPDALVVDQEGLNCLTPELRAVAPPLILDLSGELVSLPDARLPEPVHKQADDLAYILFTSGTTGVPKGVMIKLGSVAQYLAVMNPRYSPVTTDRTALTSEISFDFSVLEMFSPWSAGASVHVVPAEQMMAPNRFIIEHQLTVWFSVPSVAVFMRRMKLLKAHAFPSLRYSVFGGEALPYSLAEAWQAAAPFSIVENHYGPAEATVFCICAIVGPDFPPTPGRNTVPSGLPLPGIQAAIIDEDLNFLPAGAEGQLAISGDQLAIGYFNDPELTRQRFPNLHGKTWYLTGDLARQDERGVFHHLGRIDHQVKVLGQRVELEEIETHLRAISGSEHVVAVPWPILDGIVAGIVAFTSGVSTPPYELIDALRQKLPPYMVPRRIVQLDAMPLNSSGKVDRRSLVLLLEESTSKDEMVRTTQG